MAFALFFLLAAAPGFEESFRAGLLALQRNDLKAAELNLGTAVRLAPGNGRVWVALAQTHWKLNERDKADAAATKAAALGANDSLVQKSLAIYYVESGRILRAAEAQTNLAMLTPADASARERAESLYFEAVQPLLQQQKFGEAVAILGKARERLKNCAQLELALGVAYYGMRRFDDAATAFLATIAITPEIGQPHIFLAKFLDQIPARIPEVTRQFVNFENAHPSDAAAYVRHAKALNAQAIDAETAEKLLRKAIAINNADPAAHFELGDVLSRTQRFADAARAFERSVELDPGNPSTHYRLSNLYSRLGKLDAARAERELHAKLVKSLDPGK